jgi:hypothetical protein
MGPTVGRSNDDATSALGLNGEQWILRLVTGTGLRLHASALVTGTDN